MTRWQAMRISLRVVFYRERDSWIAHCLEFDLIGNGATRFEATGILIEAIALECRTSIEHDNPANLFCPADGECFMMFAAGDWIVLDFSDERFGRLCSEFPMIKGIEARVYESGVEMTPSEFQELIRSIPTTKSLPETDWE